MLLSVGIIAFLYSKSLKDSFSDLIFFIFSLINILFLFFLLLNSQRLGTELRLFSRKRALISWQGSFSPKESSQELYLYSFPSFSSVFYHSFSFGEDSFSYLFILFSQWIFLYFGTLLFNIIKASLGTNNLSWIVRKNLGSCKT